MKLKIQDIPEEGLNLQATAPKDQWFGTLLKLYGEDYPPENKGKLALGVSKTCDNVFISGQVEVDLSPTCDRCLETFTKSVTTPIRLHVTPAPTGETHADEEDELDEDEDFAFYRHGEIDLGHLLRETLSLEIPLRDLCREDCQGLCPRCGKNLNSEKCVCRAPACK